jgi:hypothetical protein
MIEPIREIAIIAFLGLPLAAWVGLLGFLLMLSAAIYGMGLMKGKIKGGTVSYHRNIALIAIAVGIIHLILALTLVI